LNGHVSLRTSTDLVHWTYRGTLFSTLPDWALEAVPGTEEFWAPDYHWTDHVLVLMSTTADDFNAIDRDGRSMAEGGGLVVLKADLQERDRWRGPGHCPILRDPG
jgi:hypothetical protein